MCACVVYRGNCVPRQLSFVKFKYYILLDWSVFDTDILDWEQLNSDRLSMANHRPYRTWSNNHFVIEVENNM